MNIKKEFIAPHKNSGNAGIQPVHEIDNAAWVWHPDLRIDDKAFVVFRAEFNVAAGATELRFHISADQRYELYCDGERIAKGPDRGDVDHWTFSTYICELTEGAHLLEAHVWWLDDFAPEALVTYRGGFIFKADDIYDDILTTGTETSLWKASLREGWSFSPVIMEKTYFAAGYCQTISGENWLSDKTLMFSPPIIVRSPVRHSTTGNSMPGWKLYPTTLPNQIDRDITPGKFRALVEHNIPADYLYTDEDCCNKALSEWNSFLAGEEKEITVAANQDYVVLWDLENYYCGFSELYLDGGADASIEWEWAESLFITGSIINKENRNEISGKWWNGFGHTVKADGKDNQHYRFYWWNAGRYCRIHIKTGEQPLVLKKLLVNETRYPLENESTFECGDTTIPVIREMSTRVMQMCAHETYMDCPYYEQMMYVGDTRLELLTHYVMQRDDRLSRRAIELFDYSRKEWGFATERVTSRELQLSATFSLIWVWMVYDYLYWRGDIAWIADRMIGVRSSLEYFRPYINSDGLLEDLPGWSFVDWVPEWDIGYPPGSTDNVSSIINLHYLLALQKMAEIEDELGETSSAIHLRERVARVTSALQKKFWDDECGLIRDDLEGKCFSEHAQALAILSGAFDSVQELRMIDGLLNDKTLARTTIYFRFYLFAALAKHGHTDRVMTYLDFWRDLTPAGFKTTPEAPEPCRSDCHAWGAHPVFFMISSLLGLKPIEPGMRKIIIAPQPGGQPYLRGSVPSPQGEITFDLEFKDSTCKGSLTLPEGMTGIFRWGDVDTPIKGHVTL